MTGTGQYLLSTEATFSAAHSLPGCGDCEQLHGHNWRVRGTVRVSESELDEHGMGIDFREFQEMLRASVREFDHAHLNDLEPFRHRPPTAELIAREVYLRLVARVEGAVPAATIAEVEVWEMEGYRAVYRPE